MTQKIINIGTAEFAGDGESLRNALIKVNDNFTEVYTSISALQVADFFDGDYNNLTNKPDLSVYALASSTFNGDYYNLDNLPILFDGDYNSLANKPTVPTTVDSLTNVTISSVADGQVLTYNSEISQWVNATPASGGSSFDQSLNTTDSPSFVGLTVTGTINLTGATVNGLDTLNSIDGGSASTTYLGGDLTLDGGGA